MRGLRLPTVLNEVLEDGMPGCLNDRAFDLSLDEARVDSLTDVVGAEYLQEVDVTGLQVDFDRGRLGHVTVGEVRLGLARLRVVGSRLRRAIGKRRYRRAFFLVPFHQSLFHRAANRVSGHEGHA